MFASLVPLGLAGCPSFSADSTPAEAEAGPGAAESGAGGETSGDAGTDGPVGGLLKSADFEALACAGWSKNIVDASVDTLAHTGARSCKVCAQTTTVGSLYQNLDVPNTVKVGSTFSGSVWLRAPVLGAAATVVTVGIATQTMAGSAAESQESSGVDPTSDWTRVDVSLPVTQDVTGGIVGLSIVLRGGTAEACVLVDDATLTVTP
jgi:hypothetical protein